MDVDVHQIPESPGCYTFVDARGTALYVGKAKSLRSRIQSHLRDEDPRKRRMVAETDHLEWVVCATEAEALLIEARKVFELQPRYNIRLRESDPYPYLALVDSGDGTRRITTWRGAARRGVQRFGPYPHREVRDALVRVAEEVYGIRSCAPGAYRRAQAQRRACLLYELGRCSAPCVDAISTADHESHVDEMRAVLAGDTRRATRRIEKLMHEASAARRFERAARLRDLRSTVVRVEEAWRVQGLEGKDLDVIGISAPGTLRAAYQMQVRNGAFVGARSLVGAGLDDTELVAYACQSWYGRDVPPRTVLAAAVPEGLAAELGGRHGAAVTITSPRRGRNAALVTLAGENAGQAAAREQHRRHADPARRAAALELLGGALGIPAPWRIEGFDISHLQGRDPVGAMVVLEDGLPVKAEYRAYVVSPGGDDYKAMREAVTKRYRRLARGEGPAPDLVVIDGGPGQLAAARDALAEIGVELVTVALAKRYEEIWTGGDEPVRLAPDDEALHILQLVRDESHRHGRGTHRRRRSRSSRSEGTGETALPEVPGLGPARRKRLLDAMSLAQIAEADVTELVDAGLPRPVAEALWRALDTNR